MTGNLAVAVATIREEPGRRAVTSWAACDLCEAYRRTREVEQREAVLQSILDLVPDGLIVTDRQGTIRSFSRAATRIFGFTAEEAIGGNVSMLVPPDSDECFACRWPCAHKVNVDVGRTEQGLRKDGTIFPIEVQIGRVVQPGEPILTFFVRDITAREDRERRLADLQAEQFHLSRLSELGQMASALAHEIDQPLTAITNYARGVRRLLTPEIPSALHEGVAKMSEQASRAHVIVQSLRGLVRKQARAGQIEALETIIGEASTLALVGAGRSVKLDVEIDPQAAYAYLDKVQIQQVLLNLMRNGAEAMEHMPRQSMIVAARRRGDRVEVSVADTGPGLSESARTRLFQPFVTTKPGGLGVGLSICRAIVQAHGGELTASDRPGGGTIFCFSVATSDRLHTHAPVQ